MKTIDNLRLTVHASGGQWYLIESSADLNTAEFIRQLLTLVPLKATTVESADGVWVIADRGSLGTLQNDKTLRENGVQDGHHLSIRYDTTVRLSQERREPNEITVTVRLMSGDEHTVAAPANMNSAEFVRELVDGLSLRRFDQIGKEVDWTIDNHDVGRELNLKETLDENGVRDGHHLFLCRRVVAGGCDPDTVLFTAFYATLIKPRINYPVLAYVHMPSVFSDIEQDAEARLKGQRQNYSKGVAEPAKTIERGTEILVVPQLPGCVFEPPFCRFKWQDNWHCIEFQMEAAPEFNRANVIGSVGFYVGPILVAEINVSVEITDVATQNVSHPGRSTGFPYSHIFVSYSHQDTGVVESLERAYTALATAND